MRNRLLKIAMVLALAAPSYTINTFDFPQNDLRKNWDCLAQWAEWETPVFLNENFIPQKITTKHRENLAKLAKELSSTYELKEDWEINKDNVLTINWYAFEKTTGYLFLVYSEAVELPYCDGLEDM